LRTDPPADARQGILILKYPYCLRHIAITYSLNKTRDVYFYRAAFSTGMLGALDAAVCLGFSLLSTIAQSNFIKISTSQLGVLPGHWLSIKV
jgi:hypothetical protein